MLPAITVDGIIYSHIKEGSYNGDQFLEWLDGLLHVMNPYPARHSVLILDNCRIHHVEGVEERCEERGIRLVYLPPYSPDLNPIEECFSFVKAYIRRSGNVFRDIVEGGDPTEPFLYLYNALELVPLSHCQRWFHDSGYV
jgi:transposase